MIPMSGMLAVSVQDASFWERMAERWGIGLVGMALFVALAWWTTKKEEKAQTARDKRDEADHAERVELAMKNNELAEKLLQQSTDHAARLEGFLRETITSQNKVADELKNVAKFARCPNLPKT